MPGQEIIEKVPGADEGAAEQPVVPGE